MLRIKRVTGTGNEIWVNLEKNCYKIVIMLKTKVSSTHSKKLCYLIFNTLTDFPAQSFNYVESVNVRRQLVHTFMQYFWKEVLAKLGVWIEKH